MNRVLIVAASLMVASFAQASSKTAWIQLREARDAAQTQTSVEAQGERRVVGYQEVRENETLYGWSVGLAAVLGFATGGSLIVGCRYDPRGFFVAIVTGLGTIAFAIAAGISGQKHLETIYDDGSN
jgi:hypothetical protein